MNEERRDRVGGFSLVEVCLAILVVALGLLSIFGLFPFGLRASESAEGDTRTSLFAESVLAMAQANAATITVWSVWTDAAPKANNKFVKAVTSLPPGGEPRVKYTGLSSNDVVRFPSSSESWIRYKLDVVDMTTPRLKGIVLHVCPGHYGTFKNEERFYTEVYFQGM
jgi:Tfp pilus assembly protein PilV